MYLDTVVKIPDVQGKITCRSKKGTTYVEYEYDREYLPERKYTIPKRKTIGKQSGLDNTLMYPNENFLKYFPEVELPEERGRSSRSCGLRIGAWIVIRKIINDYGLDETLGRFLPPKDVGLFLDLAAYSIVEEDNRAQYYPVYAYSHPLFADGMSWQTGKPNAYGIVAKAYQHIICLLV